MTADCLLSFSRLPDVPFLHDQRCHCRAYDDKCTSYNGCPDQDLRRYMDSCHSDISVGQIQADIKVPGRTYLVNRSVDDRIQRNEKPHHHHDPRRHTEAL